MPKPTPFHTKTAPLCYSHYWKSWAGYYAVRSYDICHEREYIALRNSVGTIDVSPLYKYDIKGSDAGKFLARVLVKDVRKLKKDQVTYLCWCDDDGKVIDDGTVTRLEENYYRLTAAEPSLSWFYQFAGRYDVEIEDISEKMGALSVQGPNSRILLSEITQGATEYLRFFRGTPAKFDNGIDTYITRTGYTGDLGFEVWVDTDNAPKAWEAIHEAGQNYGIHAAGLDAMDVTRIEAGFIMNGVDYFSANHCLIDSRKSTPFEINLGWTVQTSRDPFIGQSALIEEKEKGSAWQTVGLVMDWEEIESLYYKKGLPPQIDSGAWRTPIPIYEEGGVQIGYATSGTWSPKLKKNLAIATLETPYADVGAEVQIEHTVEFERHKVTAIITKMPFFDPERKKLTPQKKLNKDSSNSQKLGGKTDGAKELENV